MTKKCNNSRLYNGLSKKKRQQSRRNALIEAGIAIFGNQGYANSTVKSICAHAKLTERYFYESFSNKEQLLAASYQQVAKSVQQTLLDAVDNSLDSKQSAQQSLQVFFEFMHYNPAQARLFMLEVLGVSAAIDQLYRQCAKDIDALIIANVAPKNSNKYQLDIVAQALTGAVINICVHWILSDYKAPLENVVASSYLVFEAVLDKLKQPSAVILPA